VLRNNEWQERKIGLKPEYMIAWITAGICYGITTIGMLALTLVIMHIMPRPQVEYPIYT
jgi:hypothetical protein